jgi:hypothetical protein
VLAVERMIVVRKLPPDISAEIRQHFDYLATTNEDEAVDVFSMLSHSLQVRGQPAPPPAGCPAALWLHCTLPSAGCVQANARPWPPDLQVDVSKEISRGLIARMGAFHECDDRFLDSVAVQLHEVTMSPDTYLFRVNDASHELYLIAGGTVEITHDNEEEGEIVSVTKGAGESVGDLAFFFGIRQTTNARTPQNGTCQMFVLMRESYQARAGPPALADAPDSLQFCAHGNARSFAALG